MLWQMGTLVGAPFGICLLSAVALPAIFIAVPAYVGRRVRFLSLYDLCRHFKEPYKGMILETFVALHKFEKL